MNRKFLSVFFSALVCSTLGHEHLKAHELQRHHARSHHQVGIHNARANQQQCNFVCPVPSPSPEANNNTALRLVFIQETNVFALLNVNLEVAIIFQIGEPIALLANGKTGVSVVINIDKETVVYFPAGSNDSLWKHSENTLVEYLQKLGPLTNVNNWKNGKSSKITSVTKDVKNIIISIIETLDVEIGLRAKINPDAVISLISVSLNSLLDSKDVLRLLLSKLNTTLTIIVGGLGKIVNLVAGLKVIGKQLNGGIQSLIRDGSRITLLLGENSGLSSLIYLLIEVGLHVDLTKILGDILKSPEALLALAVRLDGGIYYGISGITAVIHSVQLYAAKKISLEALIDILIQVQAVNGHVKITKEVWNNVLNGFFLLAQTQAKQFNTGDSWSTLTKFFQDIKDEKLNINGINVSAILNILISTSGHASLNNVVNILLQLKPLVNLNKLIATLYFRLVYFVISGQGLVFIKALLPDIKISIDLSLSTGIIQQILSNVNVLQILSSLLRLDIVGVLTNLPILGPILKALEDILKAVGIAAEVTVTSALKAVGSILDDLKNIILFGLGKGGKAPSDKGIAGLSILGGGIAVSIKTTWTEPVSWSSSSTSQAEATTVSSSSTGGGSSGVSGSHSGGISIGGGGSSSGGSSSGGSGSHSGGISIGGGGSNSGGSSSGGSGSHSGGISIGGGGSSSGGSSSGGSGSHSGGISVGGGADGSGGSSVGGSGSHSGGISIGGNANSGGGGSSSGGSASHSGGISVGGSGGGKGGGSWSLGNLLGGGGGGSASTHRWSLF